MQVLRKRADAVLFGASTLRAYKNPALADAHASRGQPLNIVVSSELEGFSPSWPFFSRSGFKRILCVNDTISNARVRKFEKSSEIIRLNPRAPKAPQIIRELQRLGVKNLLVEGGGEIMWEFARENLIDDYFLTLTPRILGGRTSPTLVDGSGLSAEHSLRLKLTNVKKVGHELYLTYRKLAQRGRSAVKIRG